MTLLQEITSGAPIAEVREARVRLSLECALRECGPVEAGSPRWRRETIALKVLAGPAAQLKLPKSEQWAHIGIATHEAGHAWFGYLVGEEPWVIVATADGKGYVTYGPDMEPSEGGTKPPTDTQWLDACALGATGCEDLAIWDLWIAPRRRLVEALVNEHWLSICALAHHLIHQGGRIDTQEFRRWLDARRYWQEVLGHPAVPEKGALVPLIISGVL
jgi:hypothetical protein